MTDKIKNKIPDDVEEVVERNYGKIIASCGIAAALIAGVSIAVAWNDLVREFAAPHIESAVRQARAQNDVYLNACKLQVVCLENDGMPDDCQDIYDDAIDEAQQRLEDNE